MEALVNYPKCTIELKPLMNFFGFKNIKELNPDLFNLLSYLPTVSVNRVNCNVNGIFFNINDLKDYLAKLFGVSLNDNTIHELEKISRKIEKCGYHGLLSQNKAMKPLYKIFKSSYPRITKKEKNLFKLKLQKILALFIDLLQNKEKYSRLENPILTPDSIRFFIAYDAYMKAKKWEYWKDRVQVSKYKTYLMGYLNANSHLVESDFSVGNKKIRTIHEYVFGHKREVKKEKQDDSNIERYNYTFLESEDTGKLLTHLRRLASSNDENDDELKEYLQRKINLYQSINYQRIKVGVESFNGYIGFVLPNGYVILDKLFESIETGKIATDNAIYVIKESDFEFATKTSKTKMIEAISQGKIEAERIIHSGDYEERVRKYLLKSDN